MTSRFLTWNWLDGSGAIPLDRQIRLALPIKHKLHVTTLYHTHCYHSSPSFPRDFWNSTQIGLCSLPLWPSTVYSHHNGNNSFKNLSQTMSLLCSKPYNDFSSHLKQNSNSPMAYKYVYDLDPGYLSKPFPKTFLLTYYSPVIMLFLKCTKRIPTSEHLHLLFSLSEIFFSQIHSLFFLLSVFLN